MRTIIVTVGLALVLVALPEFHAPATAQDPAAPAAVEQTTPEQDAGFFGPSGGPSKAVLARTQTSPSVLAEGTWRVVPGASVARVVAVGTTDLFSVSFSAECQVRSLGVGDTARIRIAHFINGIQVAPLEPYDGDQRFCSANEPLATHAGSWAMRVGAGTHVLRVEIMPVDFGVDNGIINAVVDDWTFQLVVYE